MSDDSPVAEPSGREFFPDDLRERDWWVNWVLAVRYEDMDGDEPGDEAVATKQPVAPYQHGDAEPCLWSQQLPDDEKPMTDVDEVKRWDGAKVGLDVQAPSRVLSDELGVGIIKRAARNTDGQPVTLLDWDDVRDPETGKVHPVCARALEESDGYAEISQSGEGIHQFVYGEVPNMRQFLRHVDDEPFVGDDLPMIEMYSGIRLVAMTGQHVEGTGDDVVDGQDLIDRLCWEFGTGTNNNEGTPTDPLADDRDDGGIETPAATPSHAEVAEAMAEAAEYDGPDPDDWDLPDGGDVRYHAVLRGRERSDELNAVSNWELIGYAAALGYELDKSRQAVLEDLKAHETPTYGYDDRRAKNETSTVYQKCEAGALGPPSVAKLKRLGLLPTDYVALDELRSDDHLTPAEKWEAWRDAREAGDLGAESVVPTAALEHVARDRGLYEFDALEDDVDELPPKAHNAALAWVNNVWADEADVGLDDDDRATARSYQSRHDAAAETWEDVRYLYEDSKQAGRKAAREVLQDRYEFMTVDEEDALYVYDEDTGLFTDELGRVRGEIFDGLDPGGHWTRHEKNEIVSGLKQTNVVQKRDLNAGPRDDPLRCVANGVLDVVERELYDHSPEYHFTRRVPVEYDPVASTEPYREFVDRMVERDADRKALFEMVGHTLLPDANARHRLFLILTGDSTNGKSEFFKRVRALLDGPGRDERNTASVKMSKLAQNRFSQNAIYGSLANIAGEIDGKKIRNTANFKDVTGGDDVELEPKGQESFFDTVNSTQMFAANDPPILGERDKEAIAERIVPIELPYKFTDDPEKPMEREAVPPEELKQTLETPEALSGFLNLALAGVTRLEDQNDVSLPETPAERLQMYEKTADPMREFGERCLKNDPDDYLVKADVTTLYKQFASARGDEISQNVAGTLHDVLRGVPDLNYTDSRPEAPDYTDTSLPLRGWDERKRVVERVTLTEEGMEYAEAAGLVERTDDADLDADAVPLASIDTGRHDELVAEFGGMMEPKPWLEEEGWLVGLEEGDTFALDYQVREGRGQSNPMKGVSAGDVVRITTPTVKTDDDGVRYVEITPRCSVEVVEPESSDGSGGGHEDGGGDAAPSDADEDAPADTAHTADHSRSEAATDGSGELQRSGHSQSAVDEALDDAYDNIEGHEASYRTGVAIESDMDKIADALREASATTHDDAVSVPTVWATAPASEIAAADRVDALLQKGAKEGRFADTSGGGYYLIDR